MDSNEMIAFCNNMVRAANQAASALRANLERFHRKISLYKDILVAPISNNADRSVFQDCVDLSNGKHGENFPLKVDYSDYPNCLSKVMIQSKSFMENHAGASSDTKALWNEATSSYVPLTMLNKTAAIIENVENGIDFKKNGENDDWGNEKHALFIGLFPVLDDYASKLKKDNAGLDGMQIAHSENRATNKRPLTGKNTIFKLPGAPYPNHRDTMLEFIQPPNFQEPSVTYSARPYGERAGWFDRN